MRESGRKGQEDSLMKKSDDPFDPWVVAIMGLLKSNEDGVLICFIPEIKPDRYTPN